MVDSVRKNTVSIKVLQRSPRAGSCLAAVGGVGVLRLLLASALVLSRAFAQADPNDLQEDPTALGDARTSPGFSIQAMAGYRRDAENNVFGFEPQIQYSRSNWYAQVSSLLAAGPGGRRNAGDVRFQFFRQLNEEKGAVPMFAILALADIPSGIMSAGLDTRLQVNVSKTIGAAATEPPRTPECRLVPQRRKARR